MDGPGGPRHPWVDQRDQKELWEHDSYMGLSMASQLLCDLGLEHVAYACFPSSI